MTVTIVLLLALALGLLVAEAHLPSGVLGALGIAAFVYAGVLYRDEGHDLPIAAIVAAALLLGGLVVLASRKVLAAYRDEPVRTGYEELVGATAEVRSPLDPVGQVFAQGTIWRARLRNGATAVPVGDRVRIESVDGLTLLVEPEVETTEGAD
jgi:membrane-bound serine protease (ClpP class)